MANETISRICNDCKKDTPLEEFRRKKGGLHGRGAVCKVCMSEKSSSPEALRRRREKYKERMETDPEFKEKKRLSSVTYVSRNKDTSEYKRRGKINRRKYLDTEAGKEAMRRGSAKRLSTPKGKLTHQLRVAIGHRLAGRCDTDRGAWRHLSYNPEELKTHLETQFTEGMSWDNYGEWHIDHITPDSWFKYAAPSDKGFKESWALENLQPMWATDNCSKQNRYRG